MADIIEVELPGGDVVEFPSSMSKAAIEGAIRKHLSAQPAAMTPTQRQAAALRSGEPVAIPGFEPGQPPSGQDLLDMAGQGIGTSLGMGVGSFAGPPGMIVGGGTGSVVGKKVARWLGGSEQPDAVESTIDAAGGAAGPAINAAARPFARAISGLLNRKGAVDLDDAIKLKDATAKAAGNARDRADRAERTLRDAETHEKFAYKHAGSQDDIDVARWHAGRARKAADERTEAAAEAAKAAGLSQKAADELRERTLKTIEDTGLLPRKGGDFIAALQFVSSGDPITAMAIFGGGRALSRVRMEAAKTILNNPKTVRWMAEKAEKGITGKQLLGSLTALTVMDWMRPEERSAIATLQGKDEDGPLKGKGEGWRDSRAMREDRDALEEMMQLPS